MGGMSNQNSYLRSSSNCLPSDTQDKFRNADGAIAEQLNSLPFEYRNAINEEIHGVRSMACEETPELIENSLKLLEIELQNLPSHLKNIYLKASSMITNTNKNNKNGSCEDLVEDPGVDSSDIFDLDMFAPQEILRPSIRSNKPSSYCYAKSRDFHLAFLRCEFFDAKKAASRLAKYLELSCELYGEEALRRPLRIDDFKSLEEIEVLKSGHQQLLPFRDRMGRRVLAVHGDLSLPSTSLLARSVLSHGPAMKLLLYMWSILIEDVDAQRKGLVVVFWPRYVDHHIAERHPQQDTEAAAATQHKSRSAKRRSRKVKPLNTTNNDGNDSSALVPDADSRNTGMRFFEAVPVRACSIHFCLPDTAFYRMIRHIAILIIGDNLRTRVKTHQGVGLEVNYALLGYGIPVDTLPMDELTNTVKTKNQASFIKVRGKIEAEQCKYYINTSNVSNTGTSDSSSDGSICSDGSNNASMIECPSLNDVIFRSGKSYMSHPGNMMFRELIEQHIDEHNVATQDRKKNLTWQVIDEVEMKGGRFLEYNRSLGTWTELCDRNLVRHKIATYFKEFRRKMRAYRQVQMNQSSTDEFKEQDGRRRKRSRMPDSCFSKRSSL